MTRIPLFLSIASFMACGARSEPITTASGGPEGGHHGDANTGGSGGSAADCDLESPALELGTGSDHFEPIREDGRIRLTWGPQGGAHLWGSLRTRGVYPGPVSGVVDNKSPLVEFLIEANGARLNYEYSARRNLMPSGEGESTLVGEIVQLLDPAAAHNVAAVFTATLEDACGSAVKDSVSVTIVDGPLDD